MMCNVRLTMKFIFIIISHKAIIFFTGDKSGRGSILTLEGQETLSMAKSLLEALVRVISDASVTVEILLLLQNYKQRFLELMKTTVPVVNEEESTNIARMEETERSLNERIKEMEEFQAAKVKVSSFTRMCDLIKPGEIWKGKRSHVHFGGFFVLFSFSIY